MKEILSLSPSQSLDQSTSSSELIVGLEKHLMVSMDTLVDHLQSLHQSGTLDKDAIKGEVNQVSRLAQAILLIRLLPSLLAPPPAKNNDKGDDVETADLFKKIHQAAGILEALCKDQTMQEIDLKAAEILEQIQIREKQIRDQIAQKQQAIAQIISDKTQNSRLR